jgi:glutamate synthase domain-containing protein 2
MLDFVELLASETGLPVGIKSAVGTLGFWRELADQMARDPERGVDFITIDGGEGGTGAAPLAFADHVALPFKIGFTRVYREFALRDLHRRPVWIGSGKLGFPETALFAFAVGCDMVNVAREAMLAIGCIQAQRCHTDRCPTGVATQDPWLMRGLDPELKSVRAAAYMRHLRHELLALAHACGVEHPCEIDADCIEVLDAQYGARNVRDLFGYEPGWGALATDRGSMRSMERR